MKTTELNISLKHLKLKDDQIIFNAIISNQEFLQQWLPFVSDTTDIIFTRSFIKSIIDDAEKRQEIFTIWFNNEFAGLIGLKEIDYLNRKVEIGYWLIEKMTGKNIMTISVSTILSYIFEKLKFNRIQIKCGIGNHSSSKIPKKLGFSFEGIERNGEKHKSKYIDLEVYSLLLNDWNKIK